MAVSEEARRLASIAKRAGLDLTPPPAWEDMHLAGDTLNIPFDLDADEIELLQGDGSGLPDRVPLDRNQRADPTTLSPKDLRRAWDQALARVERTADDGKQQRYVLMVLRLTHVIMHRHDLDEEAESIVEQESEDRADRIRALNEQRGDEEEPLPPGIRPDQRQPPKNPLADRTIDAGEHEELSPSDQPDFEDGPVRFADHPDDTPDSGSLTPRW